MNIKRESALALIFYNVIAFGFLFWKVFIEGSASTLVGILGGAAISAPILTIGALRSALSPRSDSDAA
ncbi:MULTISPECIES: hypothetical protein [unclassified Novosphingobium]|uniref:hypothetical protein n=1 Tax=unclassified Novosphingobium TaxID=2644732 RepID=UPI000D31E084|nr:MULTISPECIES: hypothetical protein [unclassified Novosphingobium]PTR08897.1 hypothetical protein C8K11_110160 [Novosphingobium sp. GV055]PUB01809.1 hypothetical protein C8K12_110160 [Novosphingobium sp. GV061]PUB17781.1 hypothetical protein C8K14_110160 [Novosphingobium sp. GV079]PUB40475.1 hypothetical protein C8K10_110160 [Novosphingobium sp. GV027]